MNHVIRPLWVYSSYLPDNFSQQNQEERERRKTKRQVKAVGLISQVRTREHGKIKNNNNKNK